MPSWSDGAACAVMTPARQVAANTAAPATNTIRRYHVCDMHANVAPWVGRDATSVRTAPCLRVNSAPGSVEERVELRHRHGREVGDVLARRPCALGLAHVEGGHRVGGEEPAGRRVAVPIVARVAMVR